MKRPAFQFYPADWRKDVELGSCNYVSRGVWWEMLCVMHECKPYGHLSRNGTPLPDKSVAELIGVPLTAYRKAIEELEVNGVFSRTDDGTIYSRRMIKDERLRNVRAEAGKHGGNPVLLAHKLNQKDKQTDNHAVNQSLTPSSSASSASSPASKTKPVVVVPTEGTKLSTDDPPQHVNGSVSNIRKSKPENWTDPAWVNATAQTLGLQKHPQESQDDWTDRVLGTLKVRTAEAANRSSR